MNLHPNDAARFWEHLQQNYRYLYLHLKQYISNETDVVYLQPITMTEDAYIEYLLILDNWVKEHRTG